MARTSYAFGINAGGKIVGTSTRPMARAPSTTTVESVVPCFFASTTPSRLAVHQQKVVARPGGERDFAQGDAATCGEIAHPVVLNEPTTRLELCVDLLAGSLFGGQFRHEWQVAPRPMAAVFFGCTNPTSLDRDGVLWASRLNRQLFISGSSVDFLAMENCRNPNQIGFSGN